MGELVEELVEELVGELVEELVLLQSPLHCGFASLAFVTRSLPQSR
jgi:hypothetical protein